MRVLEPLHRIGFASARLAISQNSGIVPLQHAPHNGLSRHGVNFLLGGILIINVVESELVDLEIAGVAHVIVEFLSGDRLDVEVLDDGDFVVVRVNLHSRNVPPTNGLPLQKRPGPNSYLDVLVLGLLEYLVRGAARAGLVCRGYRSVNR